MTKKYSQILKLLSLLCLLLIFNLQNSHAQMPPKAKAFLGICAYGTVGGALLGFATLAFQENPRAIAQGASLGLYTGIIFGAIIVSSHGQKNKVEESYDPYAPPPPGFDDGSGGFNDGGYDSGGSFGDPQPMASLEFDPTETQHEFIPRKAGEIPIRMTLARWSF